MSVCVPSRPLLDGNTNTAPVVKDKSMPSLEIFARKSDLSSSQSSLSSTHDQMVWSFASSYMNQLRFHQLYEAMVSWKYFFLIEWQTNNF